MKKETDKTEVVPAEAVQAESVIEKTTLEEWGARLPLADKGFPDVIEHLKWTMKKEKELGTLKLENQDASLGQYVSMVLSHMYTTIGQHDIKKMGSNKTLLYISQMFIGNVYYIYCYLRYKSLGRNVPMKITCKNCRYEFDFEADLKSLEVKTAKSVEAFYWDYMLKDPFEIRGKMVKGFHMGPAVWNVMENATSRVKGDGELKEDIIRGSIRGIIDEKEQYPIAETELDEMGKEDLERISSRIEQDVLGPDMSVKANCDRCRKDTVSQLNWNYDNFFVISSL